MTGEGLRIVGGTPRPERLRIVTNLVAFELEDDPERADLEDLYGPGSPGAPLVGRPDTWNALIASACTWD